MRRKKVLALFFVIGIMFPIFSHAAGFGLGFLDTILGPLGYLLIQISSFFLWVSGVLLNYSINLSVIHFKDYIEKITVIEGAWKILRDVANIFFVIALLKAGFDHILDLKGKSDIGKLIPNLVIAAIGMNFSILIATTAIDVSNAFSLHFYRSVISEDANKGQPINQGLDGGITAEVMNLLGLQTFFSDGKSALNNPTGESGFIEGAARTVGAVGGAAGTALGQTAYSVLTEYFTGKGFSYYLMAAAIILMVAFTFSVAAIMFIYRTIVFIILLITAPFAFLDYVWPEFGGNAKSWWKHLRNECMWPPVYFLALFIGMNVLRSDQFQLVTKGGSNGGFVGLLAGDAAAAGTIFNFIVVTTILNGAILVAKNFGPQGLGAATGFSTKLMNNMLSGGTSLTAWTGRQTVGRGLQSLGGTLGKNTALGKFAINTGQRSFDMRALPLADVGAGQVKSLIRETSNSSLAVDFGKAGAGTKGTIGSVSADLKTFFGGDEKAQLEAKIKYYDTYGEMSEETNAKINGGTYKDKNGADVPIEKGSAAALAESQEEFNKKYTAFQKDPENKTAKQELDDAETQLNAARYKHDKNLAQAEKDKKNSRLAKIQATETNPDIAGKLIKKYRDGDDATKGKTAANEVAIKEAISLGQAEVDKAINGDSDGKGGVSASDLAEISAGTILSKVGNNIPVLDVLTPDYIRALAQKFNKPLKRQVYEYFTTGPGKTNNIKVANFFEGKNKNGQLDKNSRNYIEQTWDV